MPQIKAPDEMHRCTPQAAWSSGTAPRSPRLLLVLLLLACSSFASASVPQKIETRHYRIWTDVDHALAVDLAQRMDAMYDEYARRFAGFESRQQPEKLNVHIFSRRDDYARHTSVRLSNTGGIFIPSRNLLAAFLEGQGRDGLRRTLQHEAFHQFAHSRIAPDMPVWLNEGIAQVFEESIWTGERFIIGQVPPRRVRQLQQDLRDRRLFDFKTFLAMDDKQWNDGLADRATASVQYNQAWAMVHFLIFASDPQGNPLYRGRVIHLLQLCRGGLPPEQAFTRAFSGNIDGFQQRFVEYARDLTPTLEASYIENQTVLADLLMAMRDRNQFFETIEAFRDELLKGRYRLEYTRGGLSWSTADDLRVYFSDPQGRLMNDQQLSFYPRHDASLPDIVCRAVDHIQLRTRFYDRSGSIEYEVLVQPRPRQ
jgi:hypothetical protein